MIKKRIEALDWLRGLMAISIMIYHLSTWLWEVEKNSFLDKIGIYGVAIFFTLSGLSMAIVYNDKLEKGKDFIVFWLKRIIRIFPLFFIVTTLSVLPGVIEGVYKGWKLYLFNISLLFGFFSPRDYIATGAWSIGNEMVYYLFTPFIILIYNFKKKRIFGNLVSLIVLLIGIVFSFHILDDSKTMIALWRTYVNPFNNMYFFVFGIFLYYNFRNIKIDENINLLILFSTILAFIFIPVSDVEAGLITGWSRLFLSLLSIIIVFNFYKMDIKLPKAITYPLEKFGMATYGVYLLHPLVNNYLYLFDGDVYLDKIGVFIFVCVFTIILSILSYYYFEVKISKYGKRVIDKVL